MHDLLLLLSHIQNHPGLSCYNILFFLGVVGVIGGVVTVPKRKLVS